MFIINNYTVYLRNYFRVHAWKKSNVEVLKKAGILKGMQVLFLNFIKSQV